MKKQTTYIALLLLATLAAPLQAVQKAKDDQITKENKPKAPGAWFELARQGKSSLLEELHRDYNIDIDARDENGDTALILSALKGHYDCVQFLVQAGADINAQNKEKNTALILSAPEGHLNCVQFLVQAGADINAQNKGEDTALILSASKGYYDCVKYLVQAGAGINAQNKKGETALILCCHFTWYVDMVKYLVEQGAYVYLKNKQGHTALFYANEQGCKKKIMIIETQMLKDMAELKNSIKRTEKALQGSGNFRLIIIQYWQRESKISKIEKDIVSMMVRYGDTEI